MTIDRELLLETEPHSFCADASELGWAPGQWPTQFDLISLGNGLPFMIVGRETCDGDLMFVRYRQANGIVDITIFND